MLILGRWPNRNHALTFEFEAVDFLLAPHPLQHNPVIQMLFLLVKIFSFQSLYFIRHFVAVLHNVLNAGVRHRVKFYDLLFEFSSI